ncbi:hypothetical protein EPUL_005084 [Erysiphe pulchra]|uniref:Uncharacterized protein n=1 Tax=Erysiphe pulchra TaxID=225359 RepID=A0A2S4PT30_9PEZI|nr:hypothetical protein EPUL_005084 [Erysiphe pulchra]
MQLYSALVFIVVIFNGSILALPGIHSFNSLPDTNSLSNRQSLSASSKIPQFSHQRKRGLLRRVVKPGATCDSTFYKQSKVDIAAYKACKNTQKIGVKPPKKYATPTYPGLPTLFPEELAGSLSMMRIKTLGKNDYVVLANNCRAVGVIRQVSPTQYIRCASSQTTGGPPGPGFPVPVRPPGANAPPANALPAPVRPPGADAPPANALPVPVRPPGASV